MLELTVTDNGAHGDLVEEQKRLEEEAMLTGYRREQRATGKARDAGREATSKVGSAMVKRIVGPMSALLLEDQDKRGRGRVTSGGPLIRELRDLPAPTLCLAAARAALQTMSRPTPLVAVARRIGEVLEDELRWSRWNALNKAQADAVRRRVNQSPSAHQRRNALAGFARRWEARVLEEAWSPHMLIGLGTRFVDYLVRLKVLELVKIAKHKPGKPMKAAHGVQLTPTAAEWAREMGQFLAVSSPLAWPLVIPPVPWTSPYGGGFHFREGMDHPAVPVPLRPLALVRYACKEQRAMLKAADLSTVYDGLNALQATPWRINPKTYGVLVKLMEIGRNAPGITAMEMRDQPERLTDEEAQDEAKLRARNNEARKVHLANTRMASKRMSEHRVFSTARKFVSYKAIYFAYNLDFRGRVYTCSDDLSPQGNDLQRGLLEFAHGDPLDEEGVRWLAINLSKTWGNDKVSFADRERWAYENEAMILRVAEDPIECTEWHKAGRKTRWQFLAACLAWKEYREKGLGSVCRLPVMLDGTCSGIQHYSALLRDLETGQHVNLVPRDKPGDLYRNVADEAHAILQENPSAPFALEWADWKIGRNEVKRPVMTLAYGSSFLSTLKYTRESVRERWAEEGKPSWINDGNERDAVIALSKVTWEAMKSAVAGPMAGMAYVRSLSRAWAEVKDETKTKLYWTSPCGFPCVPSYMGGTSLKAITATIDGDEVILSHRGDNNEVNWRKLESALPPNFVHSLDASHLIFTLKRAGEAGITNLAAVHDAFGTTPTMTAQLAPILREEFAKLYAADPFECLRATLKAEGVDLPEEPAMGALDTAQIAHAEYLFS